MRAIVNDFGHYIGTVLVDVVLILLVSRTTKITATLFPIISTYSPWRQKNREARSTALQLIHLITVRVVAGRDCTECYVSQTLVYSNLREVTILPLCWCRWLNLCLMRRATIMSFCQSLVASLKMIGFSLVEYCTVFQTHSGIVTVTVY